MLVALLQRVRAASAVSGPAPSNNFRAFGPSLIVRESPHLKNTVFDTDAVCPSSFGVGFGGHLGGRIGHASPT